MMLLRVVSIQSVRVYGRKQGDDYPVWKYNFDIAVPTDLSLPVGFTMRKASLPDYSIFRKIILEQFRYLLSPFVLGGFGLGSILLIICVHHNSSLVDFWEIPLMLILSVFSALIPSIISYLRLINLNPNIFILGIWLIEFNGQLVAWVKLTHSEQKSYIQYLFVAHAVRRRGLGSALVKRLIQEATLPLYVNSLPERVSFYTRLGFLPLRTKGSADGLIPLVDNDE